MIFTCKPETSQKTVLDAIHKAREVIPRISVVRSFTAGLDKGLQPGRSGDFAVVADFDSVEDVQSYIQDPIHVDYVKTFLEPIVAARISVQFEF